MGALISLMAHMEISWTRQDLSVQIHYHIRIFNGKFMVNPAWDENDKTIASPIFQFLWFLHAHHPACWVSLLLVWGKGSTTVSAWFSNWSLKRFFSGVHRAAAGCLSTEQHPDEVLQGQWVTKRWNMLNLEIRTLVLLKYQFFWDHVFEGNASPI